MDALMVFLNHQAKLFTSAIKKIDLEQHIESN